MQSDTSNHRSVSLMGLPILFNGFPAKFNVVSADNPFRDALPSSFITEVYKNIFNSTRKSRIRDYLGR